MAYWTIGLLAAIVLIVVNHDVLSRTERAGETAAQQSYRRFLLAVLAYFVTDAFWGVFDRFHLVPCLYIDTVIYFIAMAASVQQWTQYVVDYLEDEGVFERIVLYAGRALLVFQIGALIVNHLTPTMFWFDADGTYRLMRTAPITRGSSATRHSLHSSPSSYSRRFTP